MNIAVNNLCRVCYNSKLITCYNCNGYGTTTQYRYKFICIKTKYKLKCIMCNGTGNRKCIMCNRQYIK